MSIALILGQSPSSSGSSSSLWHYIQDRVYTVSVLQDVRGAQFSLHFIVMYTESQSPSETNEAYI
jgi:hypothetical protein